MRGGGSNTALIIDSNITFSIIVAGGRARAYGIIAEHKTSNFSPRGDFNGVREHAGRLEKSTRMRVLEP